MRGMRPCLRGSNPAKIANFPQSDRCCICIHLPAILPHYCSFVRNRLIQNSSCTASMSDANWKRVMGSIKVEKLFVLCFYLISSLLKRQSKIFSGEQRWPVKGCQARNSTSSRKAAAFTLKRGTVMTAWWQPVNQNPYLLQTVSTHTHTCTQPN